MPIRQDISSMLYGFTDSTFGWLTLAVLTALFIALPLFIVLIFRRWVLITVSRPKAFLFAVVYGISQTFSLFLVGHLPYERVSQSTALMTVALAGAIWGMALLAFLYLMKLILSERYDPEVAPFEWRIKHRESHKSIPKQQIRRRVGPLFADNAPSSQIRVTRATSVEFPVSYGSGPIEIPKEFVKSAPKPVTRSSLPAPSAPTAIAAPSPSSRPQPPRPRTPVQPEPKKRGRHSA